MENGNQWTKKVEEIFPMARESCFCRFAGVDDRNSLMKLFIFTNFHLYANWSKFSILTRKLVARFLAILIYYKFGAPSARWDGSTAYWTPNSANNISMKRANLDLNLCNTWLRSETNLDSVYDDGKLVERNLIRRKTPTPFPATPTFSRMPAATVSFLLTKWYGNNGNGAFSSIYFSLWSDRIVR